MLTPEGNVSLGLRIETPGVLNTSGRGNENEENRFSRKALVTITYVSVSFERGTLPVDQQRLPHDQ